jgi:hypothetical protein
MYQKMAIVSAFLFLFFSCRKLDHHIERLTQRACEVERFTGPIQDLFPVTGGAKNTLYDDGRVRSLQTRAFQFLGADTDSINCTFLYIHNVVHVKQIVAAYELVYDPNLPPTGDVTGPSTTNPTPRLEEYDVIRDVKTGYAKSAGDMQFVYNNGRLQSYSFGNSVYQFEYDNKGNLIKEGLANARQTFWLHEYDESGSAKFQFYPIARTKGHERYLVLQTLGWLPPMQKNLRIRSAFLLDDGEAPGVDYEYGDLEYENHTVDANGFLSSYIYNGSAVNNQTITIQWKCGRGSGISLASNRED